MYSEVFGLADLFKIVLFRKWIDTTYFFVVISRLAIVVGVTDLTVLVWRQLNK